MYKYLVFVLILVGFGFVSISENTDPPKSKLELGKLLFFDPILSLDSTISCASCHKPEYAFADTFAISPGIQGRLGRRNAPSVMNMAFRDLMFLDGRSSNLRDQVHFPIGDTLEMGFNIERVIHRLKRHPDYSSYFEKLYGSVPSSENISDAIAIFEESLETSDTEFDRWMNDQKNNMTASAIRGREIFMSKKAKCFDCHFGPDFTGDEFKNIGLYDEMIYVDKGRYEITKDSADLGRFKVPGLRNVAITRPYMHDGSFETLREVIEYYDNPSQFVKNPINIDTLLLEPLHLTSEEKQDLEAFLLSLTDIKFLNKT